MDEMRYGTRTEVAKRWTIRGQRPSGPMKYGYKYRYLYQACQPASGRTFELFLPNMRGFCFTVFLYNFVAHYPKQTLVLDNAGSHHVDLEPGLRAQVNLEYLPPYSPDFNPQERLFQELRKPLKGKIFYELEPIEQTLMQQLNEWKENPNKVKQLTAWHWIT